MKLEQEWVQSLMEDGKLLGVAKQTRGKRWERYWTGGWFFAAYRKNGWRIALDMNQYTWDGERANPLPDLLPIWQKHRSQQRRNASLMTGGKTMFFLSGGTDALAEELLAAVRGALVESVVAAESRAQQKGA